MNPTETEIDAMSDTELAVFLRKELLAMKVHVCGKPRDGFFVPTTSNTHTNCSLLTFRWESVLESIKNNVCLLLEYDDRVYVAASMIWKGLKSTVCLAMTDIAADSPKVDVIFENRQRVGTDWIFLFLSTLVTVLGQGTPTLPSSYNKDVKPRDIAKVISISGMQLCSTCQKSVFQCPLIPICYHCICRDCEHKMVTKEVIMQCRECKNYLRSEYQKPSSAKRLKLDDGTAYPTRGPFNDDEVKKTRGTGDCGVCLETYVDAYMARCGHTFCRACWIKVADGSDMATCPACRTKCSLLNMVRNYAA
jgi:hypothetical protein